MRFRNPLFICANYDPLLLSFLVPVAFCHRLTSKTTEWCVRCDSYGKIIAMVEEGFSFMVSVSFNAEFCRVPSPSHRNGGETETRCKLCQMGPHSTMRRTVYLVVSL